MSRSPRRLLRRAADALGELDDVRAKHPELAGELAAALGAEGVARLADAAQVVREAAATLDAAPARGPHEPTG